MPITTITTQHSPTLKPSMGYNWSAHVQNPEIMNEAATCMVVKAQGNCEKCSPPE